jgi:hypothetical protein
MHLPPHPSPSAPVSEPPKIDARRDNLGGMALRTGTSDAGLVIILKRTETRMFSHCMGMY